MAATLGPPPLRNRQVRAASYASTLTVSRLIDSDLTASQPGVAVRVTLNIQTDRPLRSPAQLLVLVQAVETAASGDEKHWLEWKRGPQLTTREGQAIAARFILAAANRPDRVGASIVGGCAYLVLGIEPGGAPVETPPDPADLDAGFAPVSRNKCNSTRRGLLMNR